MFVRPQDARVFAFSDLHCTMIWWNEIALEVGRRDDISSTGTIGLRLKANALKAKAAGKEAIGKGKCSCLGVVVCSDTAFRGRHMVPCIIPARPSCLPCRTCRKGAKNVK